jgi:hypothetical protein
MSKGSLQTRFQFLSLFEAPRTLKELARHFRAGLAVSVNYCIAWTMKYPPPSNMIGTPTHSRIIGISLSYVVVDSVNDLHNAMSARINEYGPIIHNGISVIANAVFGRRFIIFNTGGWKLSANAHFLTIGVRWTPLGDDILAKPRSFVVCNSSHNSTAHASYYGTDGPADHRTTHSAANSACGCSALCVSLNWKCGGTYQDRSNVNFLHVGTPFLAM